MQKISSHFLRKLTMRSYLQKLCYLKETSGNMPEIAKRFKEVILKNYCICKMISKLTYSFVGISNSISMLSTSMLAWDFPTREGSGVEVSKAILHLGWKFHSIGFLISKFEFWRRFLAGKFKFTNKKSNGMEFPSQMENCFWNFYSWPFSSIANFRYFCTHFSDKQILREINFQPFWQIKSLRKLRFQPFRSLNEFYKIDFT